MRLKEDSDSWKAGGILRRDFRSGGREPERTRRTPSARTSFVTAVVSRAGPTICPS